MCRDIHECVSVCRCVWCTCVCHVWRCAGICVSVCGVYMYVSRCVVYMCVCHVWVCVDIVCVFQCVWGVHVCVRMYRDVHVCVCVQVGACVSGLASLHVWSVHVCVRVWVCMHVCVSVYVCRRVGDHGCRPASCHKPAPQVTGSPRTRPALFCLPCTIAERQVALHVHASQRMPETAHVGRWVEGADH